MVEITDHRLNYVRAPVVVFRMMPIGSFTGRHPLWPLIPSAALAYAALVFFRRAQADAARLRERDAQLRNAQLTALRMPLQPHFLLNSLGAIGTLVRGGEASQAMLALSLLGDVVRGAINAGNGHTATLTEELELVSRYLDIERMRFGERLRLTMDIPSELRDVRVPTFVLQPFVENALKHGILRDHDGSEIRIRARHGDRGEVIVLTVRDDGRGLTSDAELSAGGLGIANTRARLEGLYGDAASLKVRNASPGVEVEIRIPRRSS